MSVPAGCLEIGLTPDGEIVINHPQIQQNADGGFMIFSPAQARHLAWLLLKKAREAEIEVIKERKEEGLGEEKSNPEKETT